ncbi:hypothetical protein RGQ15_21500 [Paracoccus sp. MBLB3053]|uniref:LysM domain-containing protein n=1 Tax=Paracoccus aurantius TaxID=3073814 RepID=A0ABU2HZE9_9RHOB|nr:hypothetical protein [Paracoccus sp. MBLB3053]MDS9470132.1 hypothetical protein [Paracoccus sp. MBLB3053]
MNEIAALLMPAGDEKAPFPPDSRYAGLPVMTLTLPDGRDVKVLARRFVPPLEAVEVTSIHEIRDGDRLDLLAAAYFGNPSQGWKILDANGIRDARQALKDTGSRLVIGAAVQIRGQSHE